MLLKDCDHVRLAVMPGQLEGREALLIDDGTVGAALEQRLDNARMAKARRVVQGRITSKVDGTHVDKAFAGEVLDDVQVAPKRRLVQCRSASLVNAVGVDATWTAWGA